MLSSILPHSSQREKEAKRAQEVEARLAKYKEDMLFNQPPKKVIKATKASYASMPGELSFREGDYFYVIHDDNPSYYDVINPVQRIRGLVPISCFENLEKTSSYGSMGNLSVKSDPFGVLDSMDRSGRSQSSYDIASDAHSPNSSRPGIINVYGNHNQRSIEISPNTSEELDGPSKGCHITVKPDPHVIDGVIVEAHKDSSACVVYKTYDDFWKLHMSVIGKNPALAGYTPNVPRRIPFLPPPPDTNRKGSTSSRNSLPISRDLVEKKRNRLLAAYLEGLIALNINLGKFFKGFRVVPSDYDPLEILENYAEEIGQTPRFKLHSPSDSYLFEIPVLDYSNLSQAVLQRTGLREIWYRDEVGREIRLCDNTDLDVLIRGRWTKVVIFVKFV